jgi:membrane associated rhomboid family serine protease
MGREKRVRNQCCGQRVYLLVYCSALVLMNLNIGPGADKKIDNWGHLGGLITGILAGLAITEQYDAEARNEDRIPDRFTEEEANCRSSCLNRCG